MKEADVKAFGTAARLLVDKAYSLFFALVEGLVSILHSKSDMVHATLAAIFLNVLNP